MGILFLTISVSIARSRTATQTFRSLCAIYIRRCFFPKWYQTDCSLIPLHFVTLHSFPYCLHLLVSSQGSLCESKASSNISTVRPVASCICFAVALRFVSCLFPREAMRCRVTLVVRRQFHLLVSQLKKRARKKCSPFPP